MPPPSPPPAQHAPVEADDPTVAQLGPAAVAAYARLEACLAEHDRAWGKCKQGEREDRENRTFISRPGLSLSFSFSFSTQEVAALRACTAGAQQAGEEGPRQQAHGHK